MDNIPSVKALEAVHEFPCPFTIKVFGHSDPAFPMVVAEVARQAIEDTSSISHRHRASSKGNHLCVTLTVTAQSAVEVRVLYEALLTTSSVRFLL